MKKLLSEVVGCRARPLYPSRRRSARIVSTVTVRRGPLGWSRLVVAVVSRTGVQLGTRISAIAGARLAPLPGGAHRSVVGARDRTSEQGGDVVDQLVGHPRSEEHTSELQSRGHLVCRLLLEKKK